MIEFNKPFVNSEPLQNAPPLLDDRDEGGDWVVSATVLKNNEHADDNADFELCSSKQYEIANNALLLKKEMETNFPSTEKKRRGVYAFAQKMQQSNSTPPQITVRLPHSLPASVKEIVRDALRIEAGRTADMSNGMLLMNVRLETPDNVRNDTLTFHHDFENYPRASVYAVSGRSTTVGTFDVRALKLDSRSALQADVPIFSVLPDRLYRWSEHFVHATPYDRFTGNRTEGLRPFIIIGFVYSK